MKPSQKQVKNAKERRLKMTRLKRIDTQIKTLNRFSRSIWYLKTSPDFYNLYVINRTTPSNSGLAFKTNTLRKFAKLLSELVRFVLWCRRDEGLGITWAKCIRCEQRK